MTGSPAKEAPMTGRELAELPKDESLRLLASVPFGRVVFTARALPAVRPVNHMIDGGRIIIRTSLLSARYRQELQPWVAGHRDEVIAISTDMVTGYRLAPPDGPKVPPIRA